MNVQSWRYIKLYRGSCVWCPPGGLSTSLGYTKLYAMHTCIYIDRKVKFAILSRIEAVYRGNFVRPLYQKGLFEHLTSTLLHTKRVLLQSCLVSPFKRRRPIGPTIFSPINVFGYEVRVHLHNRTGSPLSSGQG